MRIYNGKNSQVDLPLATQRLSIPSHSVSKDFMPNNEFLSLLASSYDEKELALIVSGPYEINMCANIPAIVTLVVQSLDEAIARFNPPANAELKVEKKKPEPAPAEVEEKVEQPIIPEVAAPVEEEEPTPGDVNDEDENAEEGPVLDEVETIDLQDLTEDLKVEPINLGGGNQGKSGKKKNKKKNK